MSDERIDRALKIIDRQQVEIARLTQALEIERYGVQLTDAQQTRPGCRRMSDG